MENGESLFSFEFVVETVSNLLVACTAPAVGFRLLDYPTVMIYHTDQEMVENLRFMATSEPCQPSVTDSVVRKEELRPNFREHDGTFCFQKGKSTLFSMTQQKLFSLLSSIPLYIILVDIYKENSTRIIGSCTVPLQSIIDELKENGSNGHAAAFSKRGLNLNLFNLMGARIGQLKGHVTLYCYGNALNKHFETSKSFRQKSVDVLLEKQESNLNCERSGATSGILNERKSSSVLKKIKRLDKFTETDNMLHIDAHLHDDANIKSTSIDTGDVRPIRNVKLCSDVDKDQYRVISNVDNFDVYMGTCCPPPLFYCSENTDPFPIKQSSGQLICHSERDYDDHRVIIEGPSFQENDHIVNHSKLGPSIMTSNEPQGPFLVQSESGTKNEERNYIRETERNRGFVPSEASTDGKVDLGAILSSLDEMPLLQGLFKEIIRFTNRDHVLTSKVTNKNAKVIKSSVPMPEHSENKGDDCKVLTENKISNSETNRHELVEKGRFRNGRAAKKLIFKATKSHRLRCAMNSNKKCTGIQITSQIANRDKELECVANKSDSMKMNTQRKKKPADVNKLTKHNDNTIEDVGTRAVPDVDSSNVDQESVKSRSPVSLEVYMPSVAGSKDSPDSSVHHSKYNDRLLGDDFVGLSDRHWTKPLDKKWSGLDDLSHLKNSTDLKSYEKDKIWYRGSSSLDFCKENESTRDYSSKQVPPSKYSDNFYSISNSASPNNGSRFASHTNIPLDHYKSSTHRSSLDKSRESETLSKSTCEKKSEMQRSDVLQRSDTLERSDALKSQNSSRRPSLRSFNSSHSSLKSQSIRSTPRKNTSDTSKPVISAHSPTTSRSLRAKPRNTYQSNDEITHSVDLSSNGSQRTDSRKDDSLPRDDIRDNMEQFNESGGKHYDQYSDDFVNTNSLNSQMSSALEEHRSPTPRHIILSQAKLGYTM